MELVQRNQPWDPFRILEQLQRDMDQVFNLQPVTKRASSFFRLEPQIDVIEKENHYVLKADLPGMSKKDISLSIKDDLLTLKGERKEETGEEEASRSYLERSYGSFSRVIQFPTEIQADKVKASFTHGVLSIELPKSEDVKPRQIEINGE